MDIFTLLFFLSTVHLSYQEVADLNTLCDQVGVLFNKGCSGLTAKVLGLPYKTTRYYRYGASIDDYSLAQGTLVGWPGHVAFYAGGACGRGCEFVNVQGPGHVARCQRSLGSGVRFAYYNYN
ncbi:unnamed protein product, partial [Mesorhabditis belari]|uniref:NlpC/P60 domain-containing protein n=1 Tax=Mesorhabditis belari TaxID=2138241 RepID=A0AAF3EU47_9BILA